MTDSKDVRSMVERILQESRPGWRPPTRYQVYLLRYAEDPIVKDVSLRTDKGETVYQIWVGVLGAEVLSPEDLGPFIALLTDDGSIYKYRHTLTSRTEAERLADRISTPIRMADFRKIPPAS